MTATIKDVARLAEVSISTVSRVINDSKPVSPEARRRVLKAIEDLGYKPNEVARSLVTKKSNLIGVIVDDIGNSYVANIVRGIEEIGRMYNYDILLCSSYGDRQIETKFIQVLTTKQVEGIILVSEIVNHEVINNINEYKIPFVYLNRYYDIVDMPTVSMDYTQASKQMMNHLIELGHKKILYITQSMDNDLTIEKRKIKGYMDSINSINEGPHIYEVNGHRISFGYEIGEEVKELVNQNEITAIFCCQDEIAIGLMNYFADNNIKIPDDISIAGFGDITLASIYRPKLTTIREPYYDIGAVAIRRILKVISGEHIEEKSINLPIQLVIRESTKKINK
ncbi:LacI family DNA-binding transcriptional regulator [Paratissierella segnis]|jgi:LacI family transcriptional regulator|uniref:LacI family DNA-binding transcriptional regulator n=1 Tax=Paratissierella segnis TaxID=2763679 RepID=A0A926IKX4_9FIRM|nr:LacI family DNA-binding transcriptional regulator [Paratissierella segnis]MBC8588765.1 LacI family DNA-binding transcriptional regulator [Paratissierella segnis]